MPASRLDRRVGKLNRGGIAVFVRDDFQDKIVYIGDPPIDERSLHIKYVISDQLIGQSCIIFWMKFHAEARLACAHQTTLFLSFCLRAKTAHTNTETGGDSTNSIALYNAMPCMQEPTAVMSH